MATVNYYLDTRRAKKDGTFPLKLRVQHNKKFLIATEFSASTETWSNVEYNKKEPNYKAKNVVIRNLLNKVESYLLSIDDRLKRISDKSLKAQIEYLIKNNSTEERSFISFIDEFIETKKKDNTIALYESTKIKIEEFDDTCTFDTIDKKWLTSFNDHLYKQGLKTNTRSIHLRNIRSVFNYCLDNEITELYPFRKFKIEKEETRKRALTREQLVMLRDYKGDEYQKEFQDIFMLMFYLIGINSIDLFHAKKLENGRLEYKRAKTGKLYSINIEPEALELIEKYKGKNYLLNTVEKYGSYRNFTTLMGRGLKRLGLNERKGLGGKKVGIPLFPDISPYWARHTWATIAASLDIPKETISQALGHEIGSHVTSIYIDFDRRKIDEANRKVIDYLNQEQGL
ncbi:MAG: tyrosine-type recombinase/integrase [Bacteroides sp.]